MYDCWSKPFLNMINEYLSVALLATQPLTHGCLSLLSWTSASLWRSRVHWTSSSTNWLTSSWRLTRMIHRLCCWCREYRFASLSSPVCPQDSYVIWGIQVERSGKVEHIKLIIFHILKTFKKYYSWPWKQYVWQNNLNSMVNLLAF